MKSISIIIPALNENEGIARTIKAIPRTELETTGYQVQVLVVDNGSTDGTGTLAKAAGADVIVEPRRGYGYAYKAGFAAAKGEIITTADADLTYPVEDIPKLVTMLIAEDLDFITTNRYAFMEKGSMSNLHKIGNAVLNLAVKLLFKIKIRDSQSGMWVFRKVLLDRVILRSNTMALSEELKLECCFYLKCKWKEVPIQYRKRIGAVKLRSWRDGLGNLYSLCRKRLRR